MSATEPHPLCIRCAREVEGNPGFCPHCNAPLTVHATTQPYQQILSEGDLYDQATDEDGDPPKAIVVAGAWVLWAPGSVVLIIMLIYGLASFDEIYNEIMATENPLPLIVGMLLLVAGILIVLKFSTAPVYRTTKRYMRQQEPVDE